MPPVPLVIHERIGNWARQLRPRTAGWPVQVIETRSGPELAAALAARPWPLAVVDLADRPEAALRELAEGLDDLPDALLLVLDPTNAPGAAALARELGATQVTSGFAPPPAVVDLLARWLPIARARAGAAGWVAEPPRVAEPWEPSTP